MRESFQWKPLLLGLVFGLLLLWMDFNDVSPVSDSMGNLDQVLGPQLHPFTEALVPLASIAVFLLLGKYFHDSGKRESGVVRSSVSFYKPLVLFAAYLALLILVDIDDILKVLNIPSSLQLSSDSPGYWLLMELAYPMASIATIIAFGKACYECGLSKRQ